MTRTGAFAVFLILGSFLGLLIWGFNATYTPRSHGPVQQAVSCDYVVSCHYR